MGHHHHRHKGEHGSSAGSRRSHGSRGHRSRGHGSRHRHHDDESASDDESGSDSEGRERKVRIQDYEDLKVLAGAKRLWVEFNRTPTGMHSKSGYEFNVFDAKKHRIMLAIPLKDSDENHRETDKPKSFAMHTPTGQEIFDLRFAPGNCMKRPVRIEVKVKGNVIGWVQQLGRKLETLDTNGEVFMKVSGVPSLGFCNQSGPDHFKADVIASDVSSASVGAIGRNGAMMENVVLGEPSGFFFLESQPGVLGVNHKTFILAIIVVLMTMYGD